jgi:hypothetical protein
MFLAVQKRDEKTACGFAVFTCRGIKLQQKTPGVFTGG